MPEQAINKQYSNISSVFLRAFVREVIFRTKTARWMRLEAKIPIIAELDEEIPIEEDKTKQIFTHLALGEIPSPIEERKGEDIIPLIPNAPPEGLKEKAIKPIPVQQLKSYPQNPPFLAKPYPTQRAMPRTIFQAVQDETQVQTGLDKINSILLDPAVLSVECPGADKPISLNRSGASQVLNLTLTSEDILKITQFFSEKTRIPLVEGVFKASLGNLIMTAVVSQFVGTRFIIQKKAPNIR